MLLFGKVSAQDCAILSNRLNDYGESYGWDIFIIQCLPVVDMIGELLGFSIQLDGERLQLLPQMVQAV